PKCTGQDVFNLACVTFGIRETWYFGLQFSEPGLDSGSGSWWLRPDRRLSEVVRSLPASCPLHFFFHVRFWVEDVGEDLLLEATVHLFYLEVKDLVLTRQQWAASPDLLPLLAAYAAQAELGDFDPAVGCDHLLGRLLPAQAQQPETAAACAEKLRDHYRDLAGLGRVEAQIEMLRLSQDLEMFGLVYFPIYANGPDSDPPSWLGISCFGVSFYEQASLVKPHRRLAWSDIRRMSCRDRKFTLVTNEAPSASSAGSDEPPTCFGGEHRGGRAVSFWTGSPADSKQILRLCVGNHELYMTRRMPDTIERQQMRATAREERARRLLDKQRLAKEVEGRAAAERLRGAAEEKAGQLGQQLAKSEAMLGLLSERARLAEDEMKMLSEQRDRQLAHMRHIHAQVRQFAHCLPCQSHCLPCQSHCLPCQSHCLPCQSHCLPCQSHCLPCQSHCLRCQSHCLPCQSHCLPCQSHCLPCQSHCLPCNLTVCAANLTVYLPISLSTLPISLSTLPISLSTLPISLSALPISLSTLPISLSTHCPISLSSPQLLAEKQSLAERASQFESLLLTLSEEASVTEAERDCLRQQLAYARQGEKSLLAKLESLLRSVGVWSSAGASDSSAELQGFGALAADAETEETSGLSTAELLARLQAERQLFSDGSAAFEADLRQLRSRVQAARLGGADPGRLRGAAAAAPSSAAPSASADPCVVTHSTAVSCPHSSPGIRAGRLSNGSRAAVTYFDEL
uniref:FERM domain-containing protein n=1 Tax=Macrostomum lignano TaxID=282301 RepID=A0A1I8H9L8_9PLAT